MELFTKLFGSLLVFVYHCFDRIVIHGYLSGLSRPEQLVYFFREVVGVSALTKEVLSGRAGDYWTLILGPKFSRKERKAMNLRRFYAIAQIEYCRNFIFKRHFPIHKLFERSCELGLWRMTLLTRSSIYSKLHDIVAQLLFKNDEVRIYCRTCLVFS